MTHKLEWDGVDLAQFGAVLKPPEHLAAWRKLSGEEGVVQAGPVYDFGLTLPDAKVLQARRRTMTDVAPDLRGSWDGKTSFSLWEVGKKLFEMGRVKYADENGYLPAQRQTLGTCFPAGTLVLMADGTEKSIEDVRPGDEVVTHRNKARRVLEVGSRAYTGELFSAAVTGNIEPIRMTAEHPVAVFKNARPVWKHGYAPGELAWTSAESLKVGDRVLMPFGTQQGEEPTVDVADYLPDESLVRLFKQPLVGQDFVRAKNSNAPCRRFVRVDAAFARLVGLYLAEGSLRKSPKPDKPNGVTFTFGGDEGLLAEETVELLRHVLDAGAYVVRDRKRPTVIRVRCDSTIVACLFRGLCGDDVYSKRVPTVLFKATRFARLSLLRGWLDGDGHVRSDKTPGATGDHTHFVVVGVTSSPLLNRGMARIAISCGIKPSCYVRKKAKHQRVAATSLNFYGADGVALYPEWQAAAERNSTGKRGTQYVRTDAGFLCKLKEVSSVYVADLPVYNLEVEEDHSYVAGGIAVHNCVSRGFSLAGNLLQFAQIANGENLEFKRVAHAVIYGGSREEGNMLAPPGNDGSYGEAAAKWVSGKGKKGGGLAYLEEIGDEYDSDKIAGQMGWKGVPKEIKDIAKDNLITDYALVTNFEEGADAIFNGKLVPVCSGQGFTMERDKDGFCSPRGSWSHCMCFGSIIVTADGRRGLGCGQSWGTMTPKGPLLLGCPSYVFGVDEATVNKMLRGKDSFALAGLQGWAAQSWPMDWTF